VLGLPTCLQVAGFGEEIRKAIEKDAVGDFDQVFPLAVLALSQASDFRDICAAVFQSARLHDRLEAAHQICPGPRFSNNPKCF
jgi:hypothetical protein